MNKKYSPVDPWFYDVIKSLKRKNIAIKIHYFGAENELHDANGAIKGLIINEKHEEFLALNSGDNVRLDRIITINGTPGPAYDEYDSYALACLDCTGGME
jgi:hypothetical protein